MTYNEALKIKVGDFVSITTHPSCDFKVTEKREYRNNVHFRLEAMDRYMVVKCDHRKIEKVV